MTDSKPPSRFSERAFLALSIAGLCLLAFIAGSVALHYESPFSRVIEEALEAGEAWREGLRSAMEEQSPGPRGKPLAKAYLNPARTVWNKKLAYNGYTLLSTGVSSNVYLVDMEGETVYRWNVPFTTAWPKPDHVHGKLKAHTFADAAHAYPNGDLLLQYSALGDTPYGYGLIKIDRHGKILWRYAGNVHHGFTLDDEGNIHTLTHGFVNKPPRGLEYLKYPILDDYIVKLSADGKELYKISLLEAFRDSPFAITLTGPRDGGDMGWDFFHANSVMKLEPRFADKFPMFKPGQLLISMRSNHMLAVLDPKTRSVVWAHNGGWRKQHAAQFLPNGHILLLDNMGAAREHSRYSRVIEFDPATLGTVWHYTGSQTRPFFTNLAGRLQRLPNGNTLINEAVNLWVFEITPDGKRVWAVKFRPQPAKDPLRNAVFTATRYGADQLPFLKEK